MSAHVSIFELKRFAEERLLPEELPAFESHLAVCGACAGRLQTAATRELRARGLDGWLVPAAAPSGPALAALVAFAASVLFVFSLGSGPLRFPPGPPDSMRAEQHGTPPLLAPAVDAGMLDGTVAFFDGGEVH